MRIVPVECLSDNYAYLVIDEERKEAAVVDPSEADKVQAALDEEGVTAKALWLTHHHWDHVGGVEKLCDAIEGLEVVGSRYDHDKGRIPRQTVALGEGDSFTFAGREVQIREIPGHTLGAIAFLIEGNLFSGDTLFVAGCGRVFEGTMAMMSESMDRLRALPEDTQVWCGHEYTVKNLRFAKSVDPDNVAIDEALERAERARERDEPTVPGSLATELETNPFLRFDHPSLAQGRDPVESFAALRKAKDAF